mmetsp:Transcript_46451/g.149244  ORF Transcript_46451/g.149244 Transcript_46451/m.149244 type:complete len:219 (+) Transcript_46451:283-939(+)
MVCGVHLSPILREARHLGREHRPAAREPVALMRKPWLRKGQTSKQRFVRSGPGLGLTAAAERSASGRQWGRSSRRHSGLAAGPRTAQSRCRSAAAPSHPCRHSGSARAKAIPSSELLSSAAACCCCRKLPMRTGPHLKPWAAGIGFEAFRNHRPERTCRTVAVASGAAASTAAASTAAVASAVASAAAACAAAAADAAAAATGAAAAAESLAVRQPAS